jgi:hypothetical protein
MSDETPKSAGTTPESPDMVSGEGGPSLTEGGAMPGGSEMEGWKRPTKPEAEAEPPLEEQAENVRKLAES